jgi:hypothetical protein
MTAATGMVLGFASAAEWCFSEHAQLIRNRWNLALPTGV